MCCAIKYGQCGGSTYNENMTCFAGTMCTYVQALVLLTVEQLFRCDICRTAGDMRCVTKSASKQLTRVVG